MNVKLSQLLKEEKVNKDRIVNILPCKCGSEKLSICLDLFDEKEKRYFVICDNCDCCCGMSSDINKAIKKWNFYVE